MKNQKGKFRSIQDQYWSHPTKTAKKKSQVKSWKEFYGSDKDLNESLFDHCKEKDEGQVDSYYHLMNNGDSYFASSKIQIKLYYPYHYLESFQNDPNQYVIEMEDRLKLIEFDNFIVKDLGFKDLTSSEGYPGFPIYYFVEKNIDVLKVPDLVRSIIDKHKELLGNDDLPYTTLTTDNLCLDCLFRQEVDSYSSTFRYSFDFNFCPECGAKLFQIVPNEVILNELHSNGKKDPDSGLHHLSTIEEFAKSIKNIGKLNSKKDRLEYFKKVVKY